MADLLSQIAQVAVLFVAVLAGFGLVIAAVCCGIPFIGGLVDRVERWEKRQ